MRRRMYFVLPDVDTACKVEDELLLARIPESHMHFLSKRGADMRNLHVASLLQKTDLFHGMFVGLAAGAAAGLVMGVFAYSFPEIAARTGTGMVAVLAIVGAMLGAWAAGMIGASTPSHKLAPYQHDMEEGHVLLMLDVPKHRVDEIAQLVRKHHPEVLYHGIDAAIPAFP